MNRKENFVLRTAKTLQGVAVVLGIPVGIEATAIISDNPTIGWLGVLYFAGFLGYAFVRKEMDERKKQNKNEPSESILRRIKFPGNHRKTL